MGFQRLQAGRSLVLVDCGAPPPPGLDGDAHAGTLSFEMSHGRERLIVNCGAYHGPNAPMAGGRARHRGAFDAGRRRYQFGRDPRAATALGRKPRQVACERAEDAGAQWVAASHDGYKPVFGLIHPRQLFLAADGEDLRGEDRLTGRAGQGFAIRFHLHPACRPR